jgi:hypothetical protein
MSVGGPTREEVLPDTRPAASVLAGLRRGALVVFVPVVLAGQALALIGWLATGRTDPWGWSRIGLGVSLASVRIAFDVTSARAGSAGQVVVAAGAFTIAVLVLAYRAGRVQATGLELRPIAALAAGACVGPGFAVPTALVAAWLTIPIGRVTIDHLEPVLWQAVAWPLLVGGCAGAVGGLAVARDALARRIGERAVAAAVGGAVALWWGTVFAFIGILVVAAASPRQVGGYARALDRAGQAGAIAVAAQALLLPNAALLVLATSMGATTTLGVGAHGSIELTRQGVTAGGAAGEFVAAVLGGNGPEIARFPAWFAVLALVPLLAAVLGGRTAAAGVRSRGERVLRGAGSGLVFALLAAIGVWAAAITVPVWTLGSVSSVTLGASALATGALGAVWGMVGGAIGATIPWSRLSAGPGRPR